MQFVPPLTTIHQPIRLASRSFSPGVTQSAEMCAASGRAVERSGGAVDDFGGGTSQGSDLPRAERCRRGAAPRGGPPSPSRIGFVVMQRVAEPVGRRLVQVEALWARELERTVAESLASAGAAKRSSRW